MEALKTVGVFPPMVVAEPKKSLSLVAISPFKNHSFRNFCYSSSVFSGPRTFRGGLVLLSSFLSSDSAKALTYDEALQQSVSSFSSDFDVGGVLDSALNFAAENPIIVGGAAAVVAAPLVVARLISKGKVWGVERAKKAYEKLGDDATAQLLDIRATTEMKKSGAPDIQSANKKAVAVAFNGEDKKGFLKRLSSKFKEPEKTTLFILDKFDGNSEVVAELVTSNGFKAAYAIKDGAEGWMNSGLPWILPKKTIDLSSFTDAISDAFGEASDGVLAALAVAVAAAGLGLLAFAEVETVLQILGSAALLQFATKKLLFAEDRKQTIQQIEDLLNSKVAPKELPDDIQQIGKALLPLSLNDEALPAQTETTPAPIDSSVVKSEVPRPLSPYPNYPDYKPPSSPIPSQS